MAAADLTLSRRAALQGAGALVLGFLLPLKGARAQGARPVVTAPNAFLRIAADDSVTVLVKHIEFGQGPWTAAATVIAEELDADWAQMRAEHAPANVALYANTLMGIQATGGSSAMAESYDQMRVVGAKARAMLVEAAANAWQVKPAEIRVEKGVISHPPTKRAGRFGQFAEAAAKLPEPASVTLKDPATFTLIGKDRSVGRLDSLAKSTGKAIFTIDIHEPGMLTVVVAHPPRFGAKPASFDATDALKVKGVVAVKQIGSGFAVYAENMWAAIKGRAALKTVWDDSAAETRGSDQMFADYRALAAKPGRPVGTNKDAPARPLPQGKLVEAEFLLPYLAHAPMEPLDGYMLWDGQTAKARFGSQLQTADQGAIARVFGLPMEKVFIETMLAGGSFGRRAQTTAHFAVELAEVAKAIGPNKPVKLVWTREDDIRGGYYRPLFYHRLQGVVAGGRILAWRNQVVGQSFMKGSPFEAMMHDGVDPIVTEGADELLYAIQDFRCEAHYAESPIPTLWWRSVGHTHTGYAVECFVDRLLEEAGQDPVQGRLALMGEKPRAAGVLKAVAELAGWKGRAAGDGRARGVAVCESFGSFVAQIAEVSIGDNGEPRVHKIWCAVDCGRMVNPDIVRAQMEGGIGYAVGHTLYAEVPIVNGGAAIGNFDEYRSLRINEMPEVEVVIVPSSEKPTGVGEPGVPPTAPAIANALAALGRERPSRLPVVRRA